VQDNSEEMVQITAEDYKQQMDNLYPLDAFIESKGLDSSFSDRP
jgi:hypothetical protein